MLALVALVQAGRVDFQRSPKNATLAGCSALPATPAPLPSDPVAARGAAGTVAIAVPTQPPHRTTLGELQIVRVGLRIERALPGYNQFQCEGNVEVYVPGPPDAPVPPELVPSPGKRILVYLAAMSVGRITVPVLAVPPIQVGQSARPVVVEARPSPAPKEGVSDLPTFTVAPAAQKSVAVLPDPQLSLRITIANTTSAKLDGKKLGDLGIQKWSATIATSSGSFTTGQQLDLAAFPSLEPGQSHSFTTVVTFKESVDRHIQPGNAVLSGEIPTKSKAIESPGVQLTLREI
jgi:hypothetical protein